MILPSQARDKHRESTQKSAVFSQIYPDYYAALLFTRLMGPTVLAPTVQQTPTPDPSAPLRAYAHCTRAAATAETATAGMAGDETVGGGDVTLLMINLATDANVRKMRLF